MIQILDLIPLLYDGKNFLNLKKKRKKCSKLVENISNFNIPKSKKRIPAKTSKLFVTNQYEDISISCNI